MKNADVSGYWVGELRGTNSGGIAIDFKQDGDRVSGVGKFHEPSIGTYQYVVQGTVGDRVVFLLTPAPNQAVNLGRVTATGKLSADEISGTWKSTLGTEGTFSVKRQDQLQEDEPVPTNNSVFIVHGHDGAAKQEVARFVEKMGLDATILHEQPNRGLTLIEKLEKYSNKAGAVIALFTPDDLGYPFGKDELLASRARQNVVLELGYFIGKIGRDKVIILFKLGVELPSDVLGVVYIEMDAYGAWKLQVGKELRDAGYSIDLNKVN